MNLKTPWQRLTALGITLAFLGICAIAFAWIVSSLSDANQDSFGNWLGDHSSAIWGFVVGALPAVAAYVFGKRVGKKEVLVGGTQVVQNAATGVEAAQKLRELGASHGLSID
jgi:drug/metabolite transporter (DMT)-like permease